MQEFRFAGRTMYGEYIKKELLFDGTLVYMFKNKENGYIKKKKKENICGNLKQ